MSKKSDSTDFLKDEDDSNRRMIGSPSFEGFNTTNTTIHYDIGSTVNGTSNGNNYPLGNIVDGIPSSQLRQQRDSEETESTIQQHHEGSYHTTTSNHQSMNGTFFADAILDLDEAHDIADTPEATRLRFDTNYVQSILLGSEDNNDIIKDSSNQNRGLQVPMLKSLSSVSTTRIESKNVLQGSGSFDNQTQRSQQQQDVQSVSSWQPDRNEKNDGDCTSLPMTNANQKGTNRSNNDETTTSMNGNDREEKNNFSRITGNSEADIRSIPPPLRPPRWPRDIQWTVGFMLFVPFSLFYPITLEKHEVHLSPLTRHPLSTATLHALLWTSVATIFVCRLLYRSSGGPDGEDARAIAATVLTLAAPVSVVVYLFLAFVLYISCPNARWATLIPLFYTFRDVFLFRRWKQRRSNTVSSFGGAVSTGSSTTTTGGYASRQAFFQALVCMTLDILARSLRRESFYRVLSGILVTQVGVLLLWRWALLGALGSGSWVVLVMALVGGKWATGTVARTLTLVASGGVMNWCFQQALSLEDTNGNTSGLSNDNEVWTGNNDRNMYGKVNSNVIANGINGEEFDDGIVERTEPSTDVNAVGFVYGFDSRIPDAYRTVDASVYQSVIAADDVLDDDYDDEDDTEAPVATRRRVGPSSVSGIFNVSNGGNSSASIIHTRSTVRTILSTGLAVSFGSIAHCGLLGGFAQFIWSQLRKVEVAQSFLSERRQRRHPYSRFHQQIGEEGFDDYNIANGARNGFRGMQIVDGTTASRDKTKFLSRLWHLVSAILREFVRNHSDLAMTHVVSYYKGYSKAARDVALLIDESGMYHVWIAQFLCYTRLYKKPIKPSFCHYITTTGVESILHDDITTHICSCIGGTITGVIVILTGNLLVRHRRSYDFDDISIVENMFVAFILSYTLIFTVMEPLRASVKAVYVSFAHCPRSISQTFPLIYHRLCRISEQNQT